MNERHFKIAGKLNHLNILHRYFIHRAVSEWNIYPGQPPLLDCLSSRDGCTQKELADLLHVSPASVAVSVKRMQRSGLVEKSADKDDLRYNRILITDRGRELNARCREEFCKIDERLFSDFSDEELTQLESYIGRMISNLSDEDIKPGEVMEFFKNECKNIGREAE